MFKRFFIIDREATKYNFIFPTSLSASKLIEKPFLYPCLDFEKYEHAIYVVVLTGISGNKNFITAKYIKEVQFSIAFESDHPWFEIIYTIINNIVKNEFYLPPKWNQLEKYLTDLLQLPHPEPGLAFYIPAACFNDFAVKIIVPMKSRHKPFSVFLMSLHKQISFENWIIIFECLLLERWIVFHSRHLNRVTNCIFASLSLIFPLEWVHLIFPCLSESSINCLGCPSPFVAGIHSCLIDKVLPLLNPGTLLVNIDEGSLDFVSDNEVEYENNHLPKCLVNVLMRNYNDNEYKLGQSWRKDKDSEHVKKAFDFIMKGFRNTMAVMLGKYRSCITWKSNRSIINNTMLAQSRGEILQPFISKLLQSQMVHQFLDDKINNMVPIQNENITFFVDDIDDFEEACTAMNKWQSDNYSEVFANISSLSRRKINDIAGKVREITKKSTFGTETFNNNTKLSTISSNANQFIDYYPSHVDPPSVDVFTEINLPESEVPRNKWITFDDNKTDNDENLECIQFKDTKVFYNPHKLETNKKDVLPVSIKDFDPLFQ